MSEIKVNSIKGVGASTAAITVNNTDGTCTANLSNRQNRNLIINGAMQVAQRGTSSTTSGYGSVDRFRVAFSGTDEAPTQAQVDVASGTTPYTLGFRKALKVTNGNQTNGAGASDQIQIIYWIEAQDIAKSGWNYKSSSSFLTFSFWIKSSVAQVFNFYVITSDGTEKNMPFSTPSLSADTWTKVSVSFNGDSSLTIDNDTGSGLLVYIVPYYGPSFTGSNANTSSWYSVAGSDYTIDFLQNWGSTNGRTFDITGCQLEVGTEATPFEHRPFGDELMRCYRYYEAIEPADRQQGKVHNSGNTQCHYTLFYKARKRATPSVIAAKCSVSQVYDGTNSRTTGFTYDSDGIDIDSVTFRVVLASSLGSGTIYRNLSGYDMVCHVDAEL